MLIEGYYAGRHRSPYQGSSTEFATHRPYVQGDDIRHVDWKVYGRTDRLVVKRYRQETNLNLVLVVDKSASMAYRSSGSPLSKYDYAVTLAASLSCLALGQRDSVALATFDDRVRDWVGPSNRRGHLDALVQPLSRRPRGRDTRLGGVLDELAQRVPRRSLIVLAGDLFDDPQVILRGLSRLRHRGHDAIVFAILDDAEINFPFSGPMLFEGLEQSSRARVDGAALRLAYRAQVRDFVRTLRDGCRGIHFDFALLNTSGPLDEALGVFLATRSARIRKRSARTQGGG